MARRSRPACRGRLRCTDVRRRASRRLLERLAFRTSPRVAKGPPVHRRALRRPGSGERRSTQPGADQLGERRQVERRAVRGRAVRGRATEVREWPDRPRPGRSRPSRGLHGRGGGGGGVGSGSGRASAWPVEGDRRRDRVRCRNAPVPRRGRGASNRRAHRDFRRPLDHRTGCRIRHRRGRRGCQPSSCRADDRARRDDDRGPRVRQWHAGEQCSARFRVVGWSQATKCVWVRPHCGSRRLPRPARRRLPRRPAAGRYADAHGCVGAGRDPHAPSASGPARTGCARGGPREPRAARCGRRDHLRHRLDRDRPVAGGAARGHGGGARRRGQAVAHPRAPAGIPSRRGRLPRHP